MKRSISLLIVCIALAGCGSQSKMSTLNGQASQAKPTSTAKTGDASQSSTVSVPETVAAAATADPALYPVGSVLNLVLRNGLTLSETEARIQALVAACMSSRGWDYQPLPSAVAVGPEDLSLSLGEIEHRRALVGYGVGTDDPNELNPNLDYLDGLSEAERWRYTQDLGTADDGQCISTSRESVYDLMPLTDPAYAWLAHDFVKALNEDDRLQVAISGWVSCMSAAGYAYKSPEAPQQDFSTRYVGVLQSADPIALADFRQDEIDTAKADTECYKREVQSVKIAVESEILDAWVTQSKISPDMWPLS